MQEAKQKPAEKSAPEAQSPYFIEQYDLRVRFESDGTGRRELHVRSRVQTQKGAQELSRLAFAYDRASEQMEINSVVVHEASGGTIEILPGAVVDRPVAAVTGAPAYEDAREKTVRVPALKPGATLEYRVTTTITNPIAPGQFWFEHNFLREGRVGEESLEVDVPRDRKVNLKIRWQGPPLATVTEVEAGSAVPRRIHRWKISNEIAASMKQPASKNPVTAAANPQTPDIQLTTFQNWDEVARWYFKHDEKTTPADESIHAKALDLTQSKKENLQKLEALYLFVAQKIRTVNLSLSASGYRSLPPSRVLAQGYGTTHDKHALLEAMAEGIGLSAMPVFLNATREIKDGFPSPAQFESVITAVQVGGELVWLDTSPEVAPFQMLASNLRNKRGFALSRASAKLAGETEENYRWLTTPADQPFPAAQQVGVDAELDSGGKLTAHVAYTLRGDAELLLRTAFHHSPREEWKTIGLLLAFSDGLHGEVSDVTPSDPEATANPFHLKFQIVQARAVKWNGQKARLILLLPGLGMPDLPEHPPAESGNAPPLQLGTPLDVTTRITITLPPGVTPRAPFSVSVKRDYAEYRSTYSREGNRIVAARHLRFLTRTLPAALFADYAAFVRAVHNDEAQEVELERSATHAAPPATQKRPSAAAR